MILVLPPQVSQPPKYQGRTPRCRIPTVTMFYIVGPTGKGSRRRCRTSFRPSRDHHQHGALEELLRQLSGINSGLVLSVGEAQSASSGDFTQLAALLQRSVRLEAPLVSLIGGLPTLRSRRLTGYPSSPAATPTPSKSSVATRGGPHKTPGPSRSTTLTPRSHRPPPSSPGRSTLDDGRRPPAPNANISRDHRPRERALGQFSDRTALLSVFGLPPFGAT